MEPVATAVLSIRDINLFNEPGQEIVGKTFCVRSRKISLKRQGMKFTVAGNEYMSNAEEDKSHTREFIYILLKLTC